MGKSAVCSLPGDNELFNDHYDHHHPGIISHPSLIIEIFQEPSSSPTEYPDREKEFGGFDKGINAKNCNSCCLAQDDTNYASDKIDPAEVIKNRVSLL